MPTHHEDKISWDFLKTVREVDIDLASDNEVLSFTQFDALQNHWSEFLIQYGSERTDVRTSTFAVTLKRAVIEMWVQQNYS